MVKQGGGADVLDYAQLVDADHPLPQAGAAVGEAISGAAGPRPEKLNTPSLVVVHVNKDGAEHGSIRSEKDAHVRLSIEGEQGGDKMTVHILKNRNGSDRPGHARLSVRLGYCRADTPPAQGGWKGPFQGSITGLPCAFQRGNPHKNRLPTNHSDTPHPGPHGEVRE